MKPVKQYFPKPVFLYLMFIPFLFTGCLDEPEHNCPQGNLGLYFLYKGDGDTEMFFDKIELVKMFIYNESGRLYKEETILSSSLGNKPSFTTVLPTGKYTIVCWGNSDSDTEFKSINSYSTAELASTAYYAGNPVTTVDSLYLGSTLIEVLSSGLQVDTIAFSTAHTKFKVYMVGTYSPAVRASSGSSYFLRINNVPSVSRFSALAMPVYTTFFPVETDNSVKQCYEYNFNTFRIKDLNNITIEVVNRTTHQISYTLSLREYIQKHSIIIDGKNEPLLSVFFTFNGLNITANPWKGEIIVPDI